MNIIRRICWAASAAVALGGGLPAAGAGREFVAYSLKQAESLLKTARPPEPVLSGLGGITLPLGLVHDGPRNDLVIVGEVVPHAAPLTLDDFVVPLRGLLKSSRTPLVSIDRVADTPRTGKQRVRFDGGIENSAFGRDVFQADVVLKKLGLGLLATQAPELPNYFEMSVSAWKASGSEDGLLSRFWFVPAERSFTGIRPGVVVVQKLWVDVKTELLGGDSAGSGSAGARDEVGQRFANAVSASFDVLAKDYPELRRLDPLFRLEGLAEGLQKLMAKDPAFKPDLDFWLNQHRLTKVETPKEYPLLVRTEFLRKGTKGARLSLEGGIDLHGLILELNDGDVSAFKEIVLRCRPKGDPLVWRVPLEGWQLPDGVGGTAPPAPAKAEQPAAAAKEEQSCSILKRFEPVDKQDRMQQRLDGIRAAVQQPIVAPHALDLVRHAPASGMPSAGAPGGASPSPAAARTAASPALGGSSPPTSLSAAPTPTKVASALTLMNAFQAAGMGSSAMAQPGTAMATPMAPYLTSAAGASWALPGGPGRNLVNLTPRTALSTPVPLSASLPSGKLQGFASPQITIPRIEAPAIRMPTPSVSSGYSGGYSSPPRGSTYTPPPRPSFSPPTYRPPTGPGPPF